MGLSCVGHPDQKLPSEIIEIGPSIQGENIQIFYLKTKDASGDFDKCIVPIPKIQDDMMRRKSNGGGNDNPIFPSPRFLNLHIRGGIAYGACRGMTKFLSFDGVDFANQPDNLISNITLVEGADEIKFSYEIGGSYHCPLPKNYSK